jgi:Rrf2 family protein
MIRVAKLTDYALLLLTQFKEAELHSANELSEKSSVPLATTNKILKLLVKKQILNTKKGKFGGFYLAKNKSSISLLDIVTAIEGDVNITECLNQEKNNLIQSLHHIKTDNNAKKHIGCELKNICSIQNKMSKINHLINNILAEHKISDF